MQVCRLPTINRRLYHSGDEGISMYQGDREASYTIHHTSYIILLDRLLILLILVILLILLTLFILLTILSVLERTGLACLGLGYEIRRRAHQRSPLSCDHYSILLILLIYC